MVHLYKCSLYSRDRQCVFPSFRMCLSYVLMPGLPRLLLRGRGTSIQVFSLFQGKTVCIPIIQDVPIVYLYAWLAKGMTQRSWYIYTSVLFILGEDSVYSHHSGCTYSMFKCLACQGHYSEVVVHLYKCSLYSRGRQCVFPSFRMCL